MRDWRPSGRWVIVAGQGTYELTGPQQWTSRGLGRVLADAGHGLVTGKWAGVDYLVAESYADRLDEYQVEPCRCLIQVVPPRWSGGYSGGLVVETVGDRAEYVEKMKHPGAVVLIGGRGATYDTYRVGEAHRKPVLPLAGTGG